jgi:hypothetical protein
VSDFTSVVRPNQLINIRPSASPDIRRKPLPVQDPEDGRVVWGSSGNDIFQLAASYTATPQKPQEEEKRTYSTVRIENPDDSDQFLETEVMTEYVGRNKTSKDRFTLRFAEPKAAPNIKILSTGNTRTSGS